jgi:hypothetical protein
VFGHDYIVRIGSKQFSALKEVQNEISTNDELRSFELLQAGVDHVCFAMNEKGAERAAPVGSAGLGMDTALIAVPSAL